MNQRITLYMDQSHLDYLDQYKNKSKIVKEALNEFRLNKEYLLHQKSLIESDIKKIQVDLAKEKLKLNRLNKKLKEIDEINNFRPKLYEECVDILRAIPYAGQRDLEFQANRMDVDVNQFKKWLRDDGYYEEIFL